MDSLYAITLKIHGFSRWLVLLSLLASSIYALQKLFAEKKDSLPENQLDPTQKKLNLLAVITTDATVLLGISLYSGLSPFIQHARQDIHASMADKATRFFLAEHPLMMLAALVLVHIGHRKLKSNPSSMGKYRSLLLFNGLAVLAIVSGIPWWRG